MSKTIIANCKVNNCTSKYRGGQGYCCLHYHRFKKYGDSPKLYAPPRVSAPKGELVKFFYESLKTETDDCILWIYAKLESGYGVLTVNGKSHKAHRLALSLSTPQPPNKPFALHNCLSKSCFNPRHLRWGDDTDNMRDRIKDGTSPRGRKHGLNKLSEDDIRAIREDTRSQVLIAKEYKVNQTNISAIKTGKSWAWL